MKNKDAPFEEGMKRLEEIVAQVEREEISLEDSIRLYEEGTKLHARLAKVLEEAKLRITRLEAAGEDDDGDAA